MRRYKLERSENGRITQCENADGGNIYAQREELNKKALANLERPTPGKLGNLSNLQVFNFQISDFDTGVNFYVDKSYNTTSTFPANAVQTVMFGVDGLSNKALYYNIVYINAYVSAHVNAAADKLENPSYIAFYLLQNSSGTSSLGTKITQPAPLYGNGGGAVTYTTNGNVFGAQRFAVDLYGDNGHYAQNNQTKGLRASGLALSEILINFTGNVETSNISIDVEVGVDLTSVSSTY